MLGYCLAYVLCFFTVLAMLHGAPELLKGVGLRKRRILVAILLVLAPVTAAGVTLILFSALFYTIGEKFVKWVAGVAHLNEE